MPGLPGHGKFRIWTAMQNEFTAHSMSHPKWTSTLLPGLANQSWASRNCKFFVEKLMVATTGISEEVQMIRASATSGGSELHKAIVLPL